MTTLLMKRYLLIKHLKLKLKNCTNTFQKTIGKEEKKKAGVEEEHN